MNYCLGPLPPTFTLWSIESYSTGQALPLGGGRCEKIGIYPLTLSSPARGEGKHIEIKKEIPSPLRGEGRVGVMRLGISM
jgi:hypothetical protein